MFLGICLTRLFAGKMQNTKLFLIVIVHVMITKYVCSDGLIRMCYFNAEARYRKINARFDVYDIDSSLCTHYVYAYAVITQNALRPMDPPVEVEPLTAYRNFTGANLPTPRNVKTLLSIGGPNASEHRALVELCQSESSMEHFANRVRVYLRQHSFYGLDIDWQYPTTSAMKWGFVKLLEILRYTFDEWRFPPRYLLTVKCPGVYNRVAYDVPAMSRYVDYVILAAYNLPTPNSAQAWFGSPLYSPHISVNSAVRDWQRAGLPVSKTVVGISPVGRFLRLQNETAFTPGSPILSETLTGNVFNIPKGLAYPEICQMFKNGTKHYDNASQMHYLIAGNTWVGYEDTESIKAKITWMGKLGVPGVMFSAIDLDDFRGNICGRGHFPLLRIIKLVSENITLTTTLVSSTSTTSAASTTTSSTSTTSPPSTTISPTSTTKTEIATATTTTNNNDEATDDTTGPMIPADAKTQHMQDLERYKYATFALGILCVLLIIIILFLLCTKYTTK